MDEESSKHIREISMVLLDIIHGVKMTREDYMIDETFFV